jgi:hypothetical protein
MKATGEVMAIGRNLKNLYESYPFSRNRNKHLGLKTKQQML